MIPHSRPWLDASDEAAVCATLRSGMIGSGELCSAFEARAAEWLGCTYAVSTASGSAALLLALAALDIGPGDEVVLPSYVCISLLEAVISRGAAPVLCDVGPDYVVTAGTVSPCLGPAVRVIVVPHLYGIFADVAAIRKLGVPVIEDCAQAIGHAGTHPLAGDLGVLSFHPTKCLTTGEGGMVVTRDEALAGRMRELRDGSVERPGGRVFAPLSDLAAALGMAQFDRYTEALCRRAAIALRYDEALAGLTPGIAPRARDTMHFRYVLCVADGLEAWQPNFAANGVHVRRGVDRLLHRSCGLADAAFPQTMRHYSSSLSLPIYPALGDADVSHVAQTAHRLLRQ